MKSQPAIPILCSFAFAVSAALAAGPTRAAPGPDATARLIVKFRTGVQTVQSLATTSSRVDRLAAEAGQPLTHRRAMALGAHVVALERPLPAAEAEAVARRLARNPDVEYAHPDYRRYAQRIPNDPFVSTQPYLDNTPGGINAYLAWDVTTGAANVVVAVVDTGYRLHGDLVGRILPGYDFISAVDVKTANDGDGRDADASDPGDWVNATDLMDPYFSGCAITGSSWHGTGVAGVVAANADNGQWTAGISWAARILPVRVLGKCGGYDSDILDGVAWAAGLSVPGVPANPYPAQIINMSLGGPGSASDPACPAAYHDVFAQALAHGLTRAIIAAAGNDGGDVANSTPGNCSEAIAVASTTTQGALAGYSNFGAGVTLSAPGGDFNAGSNGIPLLSNFGDTTPTGDAIAFEGGTSFAAPMVAGVAALVLSVAPQTTAAQLRALLTSTAKPFPAGSSCTTARCGAGIVNAYGAVLVAQSAASLNFQGLWWKAPAGSEAGWGINFTHDGDTIFATWFTYDLTGKGWWLTMQAEKTATNTYAGPLYESRGPTFNGVPFNVGARVSTPVGSGTLTFSDVNNGTFAYTVNGIQQSKPLTREVLIGQLPTCTFGAQPNLALATNYQGLWWAAPAGVESGWGINFAHEGDTIFASWFTYDTTGAPLWLVVTALKTGLGVYAGTLYRVEGPTFNAYDPAQRVTIPSGSATFTFADGNNATFAYTVTGVAPAPVTQVKAITRQLLHAPGTTCQ